MSNPTIIPRCLALIKPSTVIKDIELFLEGKDLKPLTLPKVLDRILPDDPSVGLVITTFGSVPYVELSVAANRRFYPDLPILIHDDGSNCQEEFCAIAKKYNVQYTCNTHNLGHRNGDMSAFLQGLVWAKQNEFDILVKMSRRWLVRQPWMDELKKIMISSQFETASGRCLSYTFGFRTECMGMAVAQWFPNVEKMRRLIKHNQIGLPEHDVHVMSAECRVRCKMNQEYERHNRRPPDADHYVAWPILDASRREKSEARFWHDCNTPEEYYEVAKNEFGLQYSLDDFVNV